jgi:hypothetical protein
MTEVSGARVLFVDTSESVFVHPVHLVFSCIINDHQVIVDYSDHDYRNWVSEYPDLTYFKYQTSPTSHSGIIPLGPPMAVTHLPDIIRSSLREYMELRESFSYNTGSTILNKQLPYGNATKRRSHVQQILTQSFKNVDIEARCHQYDFWKMSEHCLVSVCVPGATNYMVDRGHMEMIGLGVCTVSPRLTTLFPYYRSLIPGIHYIECADDYSDLASIIEHLRNNKSICQQVGKNAREFYETSYHPRVYINWILSNL